MDKSYWKALDRVRKDFSPTKPKSPEKKLLIVRKLEYYQDGWPGEEIRWRRGELLEIYNSSGTEDKILKTQFLRKLKVSGEIMERELVRLDRI